MRTRPVDDTDMYSDIHGEIVLRFPDGAWDDPLLEFAPNNFVYNYHSAIGILWMRDRHDPLWVGVPDKDAVVSFFSNVNPDIQTIIVEPHGLGSRKPVHYERGARGWRVKK